MNPLFRLFAWIESFTLPKFCFDCGAALERVTENGVGKFADEEWTFLQCPRYAFGRHYSHIIHWHRRPGPFDPRTGKPRGAA